MDKPKITPLDKKLNKHSNSYDERYFCPPDGYRPDPEERRGDLRLALGLLVLCAGYGTWAYEGTEGPVHETTATVTGYSYEGTNKIFTVEADGVTEEFNASCRPMRVGDKYPALVQEGKWWSGPKIIQLDGPRNPFTCTYGE